MRPRLRNFLVLIALIVIVFQIGARVLDVTDRLEQRASAPVDSVQWTLSQTEVEFFKYQIALEQAQRTGTTDLSALRQRFNILYSRISSLLEGRFYSVLVERSDQAQHLEQLRNFLNNTVPLIDGSDAELLHNIDRMRSDAQSINLQLRNLVLGAMSSFAEMSDQQRNDVTVVLWELVVMTACLIIALILLIWVLSRVVTTTRKISRENAEGRARLEAMIQTSQDAILVMDELGRVIESNEAASDILGYDQTELHDHNLADLITPEHLQASHHEGLQDVLEIGEAQLVGRGLVQVEARHKSGRVFTAELSVSQANSDGKRVFVSFMRDISDRIEAENTLRQARDDAQAGERAKADLLAVMSHEIRTPLNGIMGAANLLRDKIKETENTRYLEVIENSGQLLMHHVNDVLELSRLDSNRAPVQAISFDLATLLRDLVELQNPNAEASGNHLHLSTIPEDIAWVTGDEKRLQRVLLNLIGNGIKFTQSGDIQLDVERHNNSDMVEFRVSDTGVGIASENLEKIFDDFVTLDPSYGRKSSGTGLGLSIAKRLVHSLGGEIGVESEPGEGSLFWMRVPLPKSKASLPGDVYARATAQLPTHAMNILVVEDNDINRLVICENLQRSGHTVTEASDGESGVQQAAHQKFDLIFMDISMPGMDGIAATRAIRKGATPSCDTTIVALTAQAQPEDRKRMKDAGMDALLTKPFSTDQLEAILRGDLQDSPLTLPSTIDHHILDDIKATLGADHALALLEEFEDELASCLGANTNMQTADSFHRVAGSAAVFGLVGLHGILQKLESAAKENASRDRLIGDARTCWTQTQPEAIAYLKTD